MGIFSSVWTEANFTLPPDRDDAAAFGEAVLRVDLGEVLIDHELDADPRRPLLAGFGQEDDVAVERHLGAASA